ncbi:MAG: metal transporter ATPase [Ilumatobacteraceae bacterium]|nr:metal transporter ATPase [Ilumatobacteraceae bacterium]
MTESSVAPDHSGDVERADLAQRGLTAAEVAERVARGEVNDVPDAPSRTITEIIRANLFTKFNALIGVLFAIVMATGQYKDALFGGVIVANTLIGIIQELRAKRTLDRLTVVNAPKVTSIRDGDAVHLAVNALVLGDVMDLLPGQQIVADSSVLIASNLEVDESLLTGEADPIVKQPGDELLSGSFVVAGNARAVVSKVGADAYAAQLAEEARRFTLVHSELRTAIDRIVTLVTWALVPTGIALFIRQLTGDARVSDALVTSVGLVVAMVPEGLILLTSVAFTVGVVRLARKRTLVQELPAIEVLARVDVICIDKTGTITSGSMDVADVQMIGAEPDTDRVETALAAIAWSDPNPNATQRALQGRFDMAADWIVSGSVAFSSARKWSASSFGDNGTWVFGAPEMVMSQSAYADMATQVETAADAGNRVLVLAVCDGGLSGETLPDDLRPAALVMLEDEVRGDAAETLSYFAAQGVTLKVISGDNPRTVGAVGRRVGLAGAENLVDARELPTEQEALADAVVGSTVFGRVSPHQKREMVKALQSRGHVVAMTGDGVNDVLALKDSDCGIAMASGSEATRAVAQLVLLDSTFSSLPSVLSEGRRVINNIERVASLFLVKTVYALFFAIATVISGADAPFLPRHLTLVGTFTIGMPAFFLALAPNDAPVRAGFLGRVLRIALPGGALASFATYIAYTIARHTGGVSLDQERTVATVVLASSAILVLARVAQPWVMWKMGLIAAMAAFLALALIFDPLSNYFKLVDPPSGTIIMMIVVIVATGLLLPIVWRLGDRLVGVGEKHLQRRERTA